MTADPTADLLTKYSRRQASTFFIIPRQRGTTKLMKVHTSTVSRSRRLQHAEHRYGCDLLTVSTRRTSEWPMFNSSPTTSKLHGEENILALETDEQRVCRMSTPAPPPNIPPRGCSSLTRMTIAVRPQLEAMIIASKTVRG